MLISSFNISPGASYLKFKWAFKKSPILQSADIILIQEFEDDTSSTRCKKIQHTFNYKSIHFQPTRILKRKDRMHGLTLLSKLPVSKIQTLPLPIFQLGSKTRNRLSVSYTIKDYLISNIHLDTRLNPEHRIAQLKPLLAHNYENKKVILGGDFNTLPYRFSKKYLPNKLINQRQILSSFLQVQGYKDEIQNTLPTHRLRWKLDALFTKNCIVTESGIENKVNVSDHFPVWIKINE